MANITMDTVLENLIDTLDKRSGEVSGLLSILDAHERLELEHLFDQLKSRDISRDELSEMSIKTDVLTSLLFIIQNNPRFDTALESFFERNNDLQKKLEELYQSSDLIKSLYLISFELYKNYYESIEDDYLTRLSILVLFSLNALLADKQTISTLIVKRDILDYLEQVRDESDNLMKLEGYTYIILIYLVTQIKDRQELEKVNSIITNANHVLEEIQKQEMEKDNMDLSRAIRISGLANILYIAESIKNYLFTGKISQEETMEIHSFIDTYCYNTIKLLGNVEDTYLKNISKLLKYALERVCNNSIWRIADRNPKFKNYFKNMMETGDNLIYTLLPSQRDSILEVLNLKKSTVLNMPTSSGKSLLAELYMLFILHNFRDQNPTICYIVPTNALINQVSRKLKENFQPFDYRIETVLPFYEVDDIEEEILDRDHIDILVTTPEKLDLLIRDNHSSLRNLKLAIMDEAHNIMEKNRGSKFELVLSTIKQRRDDVRFLLLSPFIKNADKIAKWLGDTEMDSTAISLNWSPTKQYIGCNLLKINRTKSTVMYFPSDRNNIITHPIEVDMNIDPHDMKDRLNIDRFDYRVKNTILLERYIELGTVMVLCRGSGTCQNLAQKSLNYLKDNDKLKDMSDDEDIKKAIEVIRLENTEDDPLIECLKYGVAYHHSRLSALVKETIEELIRKNKIKIITATTTLAQGMNFPITTVIFETTRLGGRDLTGAEFWNIAGRAGRTYKDKEGHIITPYTQSQINSKRMAQRYIRESIKELISSLTDFFENIEDVIEINYSLIRENTAISNFLQYLNHILRVSYQYNLDEIDIMKVKNMLNTSLVYKELEWESGYMESQEKIDSFVFSYLEHLKDSNTGQLTKADLFGVSDISFNVFSSAVRNLRSQIVNEDNFKASKVILENRDIDYLSKIVKVLASVPEIKLDIFGQGQFRPESVAKIVIGWVHGDGVNDIAEQVKDWNADYSEVLGKCYEYINGKLKSFIPWGISMYQDLTDDLGDEEAKNLPSYIYYGVNDYESVILSKIGVPRFAVDQVKSLLDNKYPNIPINTENINRLAGLIKKISADEYNFGNRDSTIIKEIIDSRI